MAQFNEYQAKVRIQAAQAVKDTIEALTDDLETIRDTLEGEVDIDDILELAVQVIDDLEGQVEGISTQQKRLSNRKIRLEHSIGKMRGIAETIMVITERDNFKTATATLSLASSQPKVLITNEEDIPTEYKIEQQPKIDKRKLKEALQSGEIIDGATLSNQPKSLRIRKN